MPLIKNCIQLISIALVKIYQCYNFVKPNKYLPEAQYFKFFNST